MDVNVPRSVRAFVSAFNQLVLDHDVMITIVDRSKLSVGGYDIDSGEPQHWVETEALLVNDTEHAVDGRTIELLEKTATHS